jgi:hypothetical protein
MSFAMEPSIGWRVNYIEDDRAVQFSYAHPFEFPEEPGPMTGIFSSDHFIMAGARRLRANCLPAFLSALVILVVTALPARAAGLTITATFDPSLTAPEIAVINSAIAFYQATFTDPINVAIYFTDMASGLGQSTFGLYQVNYVDFITQLRASATSADDDIALGGGRLPIATLNPVTGTNILYAKAPILRALGFSGAGPLVVVSGVSYDGEIGIRTSITDADGGQYSLLAVTEHEIDEVLGLGSNLPNISTTTPAPEDLFRYAGTASVRNFSANASCTAPPQAFFSIDGTAHVDEFNNCNNGGDYGDWITHSPAQVQDAFATPGSSPFLNVNSPEIRALDVMGYHLALKKRRGQFIGD